MKVLFIGNSHTYYNDMPQIFKEICEKNSVTTSVTMLTKGGMGFDYHVNEEQVRFNLLYGDYNYVFLQHTAHPFGDEEVMFKAAEQLHEIIKKTATTPILYMTWTEKSNPQGQERMSKAYFDLGKKLCIPVSPVGLVWEEYQKRYPNAELYFTDGEHASVLGSTLVAYTLATTALNREVSARTASEEGIARIAHSVICAN